MVRKIWLLFGLYAISSPLARAQDKAELFGGFSYMRFLGSNLNGWEISGQYKFTDWLGGVADLTGTTDRSTGSAHRLTHISSDHKSHYLPACRHLVTCCLAERITAQGGAGDHPSQWRSAAASMRS